jgi:hypothetical protein
LRRLLKLLIGLLGRKVLLVLLVLLTVRKERARKELILNRRRLGLDLGRRSRDRRGIAIGQLLGHLLNRIGGGVHVHDEEGGTFGVLHDSRVPAGIPTSVDDTKIQVQG